MKAKITVIIEYDINLEHYPEGTTPEEALKIDEENDAHYGFVETGDYKTLYELVEE